MCLCFKAIFMFLFIFIQRNVICALQRSLVCSFRSGLKSKGCLLMEQGGLRAGYHSPDLQHAWWASKWYQQAELMKTRQSGAEKYSASGMKGWREKIYNAVHHRKECWSR